MRGFSLIELLITLAIIGTLGAVVTPVAQVVIQREREQVLTRSLLEIRRALDAYKRASDEGRIAKAAGASGYPPNLDVLVEGVTDLRDPKRSKLYFLRRIPSDPMQSDTGAAAQASWGKRSYDSPSDQPREGADVFDVYSRSSKTGLNGVPYGLW